MAWIWRGSDTPRAMKMKRSKTMTDQKTLDQFCINTIRPLSMDGVQAANSGHAGTPSLQRDDGGEEGAVG